MKRARVTVAVVVAVILMNQQPAQAAQTAQRQTVSTAPQPNDFQDPTEYNAYMTALNSDPWRKGPAMEAFAKQYPQSRLLTDALEQAMAAYQYIGKQDKTAELLKRILEPMPSNVRELAVTVALDRMKWETENFTEGCSDSDAQTGLQQLPGWPKPEGITDSNFVKIRKLMSHIFYGAAGFCALKNKDYASARVFYEKAFQLDPTNMPGVWQLAIADLEMNPIDVNGLWYCAKAINLLQDLKQKDPSAVNLMARYCKTKYEKYHGSEDGWDQIVRAAAKGNAPPSAHPVAKK
jgi:tetratricopeptide (TPR) repeat protein